MLLSAISRDTGNTLRDLWLVSMSLFFGWARDGKRQHDVAEFAAFILGKARVPALDGSWQAQGSDGTVHEVSDLTQPIVCSCRMGQPIFRPVLMPGTSNRLHMPLFLLLTWFVSKWGAFVTTNVSESGCSLCISVTCVSHSSMDRMLQFIFAITELLPW